MPVSPWLDNTPVIPVGELTPDELLDAWASHRNDTYGIMAAEEIMRRLYATRLSTAEAVSALFGLQRVQPPTGPEQS
jgi:hypothetical protein